MPENVAERGSYYDNMAHIGNIMSWWGEGLGNSDRTRNTIVGNGLKG